MFFFTKKNCIFLKSNLFHWTRFTTTSTWKPFTSVPAGRNFEQQIASELSKAESKYQLSISSLDTYKIVPAKYEWNDDEINYFSMLEGVCKSFDEHIDLRSSFKERLKGNLADDRQIDFLLKFQVENESFAVQTLLSPNFWNCDHLRIYSYNQNAQTIFTNTVLTHGDKFYIAGEAKYFKGSVTMCCQLDEVLRSFTSPPELAFMISNATESDFENHCELVQNLFNAGIIGPKRLSALYNYYKTGKLISIYVPYVNIHKELDKLNLKISSVQHELTTVQHELTTVQHELIDLKTLLLNQGKFQFMTAKQLKSECTLRNLSAEGTKSDLINKLLHYELEKHKRNN